MNNSQQTYESNLLKIAINKYLDKKLISPQTNLTKFELNKDEIVWDVVSTIYTQSGYKVSMSFARDIVYQRINDMKEQLKKDEEKARLEMIKIQAEEEKARLEIMRLEKERKILNYHDRLLKELNFDQSKLDVFIKVHQLCEEYLGYPYEDKLYEEGLLNKEVFIKILETEIFENTLCETETFIPVSNYQHGRPYIWVWGTCGNSCDPVKLLMALEEEFEIEITDEEVDSLTYMKDIVDCIYRKITNL